MKFDASIQGVDLEKELEKQGVDMPRKEEGDRKQAPSNTFLFGDPEDYEKMPMDDREALTKQMMGKHKAWGKDAGGGLEAVEKRG